MSVFLIFYFVYVFLSPSKIRNWRNLISKIIAVSSFISLRISFDEFNFFPKEAKEKKLLKESYQEWVKARNKKCPVRPRNEHSWKLSNWTIGVEAIFKDDSGTWWWMRDCKRKQREVHKKRKYFRPTSMKEKCVILC